MLLKFIHKDVYCWSSDSSCRWSSGSANAAKLEGQVYHTEQMSKNCPPSVDQLVFRSTPCHTNSLCRMLCHNLTKASQSMKQSKKGQHQVQQQKGGKHQDDIKNLIIKMLQAQTFWPRVLLRYCSEQTEYTVYTHFNLLKWFISHHSEKLDYSRHCWMQF